MPEMQQGMVATHFLKGWEQTLLLSLKCHKVQQATHFLESQGEKVSTNFDFSKA